VKHFPNQVVLTEVRQGFYTRSMEKKSKPLTNRQKKFIAEYIVDQNIAKSCKRAKISNATGHRMIANEVVAKAIDEAMNKALDDAIVTKEYVLKGLKEVADRCMQKVPVMYFDKFEKEMVQETVMVKDEVTGEVKEEGVWRFDSAGANKAFELLGKNMKMFTDKVEVTKGEEIAHRLSRARKRASGK
jgi:phage terminase small subunit